jgi:hypothetical protein
MRTIAAALFLLFAVQSAISADLEYVEPDINVAVEQDMAFIHNCASIARIYYPRLSNTIRMGDALSEWLIARIQATCRPPNGEEQTLGDLLNKCVRVAKYLRDDCTRDVVLRASFLAVLHEEERRPRLRRK